MSGEERRQACYWHACIQYANSQSLTNASLRERFGMADSGASQISRLIRECVDNGLIPAGGCRRRAEENAVRACLGIVNCFICLVFAS